MHTNIFFVIHQSALHGVLLSFLLLSGYPILILSLTDRTDCTDFLAYAMCFSTTEMTDLTDFVSIACSLRY